MDEPPASSDHPADAAARLDNLLALISRFESAGASGVGWWQLIKSIGGFALARAPDRTSPDSGDAVAIYRNLLPRLALCH